MCFASASELPSAAQHTPTPLELMSASGLRSEIGKGLRPYALQRHAQRLPTLQAEAKRRLDHHGNLNPIAACAKAGAP